jgi:subtilisin family serine protease
MKTPRKDGNRGASSEISPANSGQLLEMKALPDLRPKRQPAVLPSRSTREGRPDEWNRVSALRQLEAELTQRKLNAWALAQSQGWPALAGGVDGSGYELMAALNGQVYIYATDNADAAMSIAADRVKLEGLLSIHGTGVRLGIWDQGAVRSTHQELVGRVSILDGSSPVSHATHAAGTLAARGIQSAAAGMASDAQLLSHDWSSDLAEMTALAMRTPGETGMIQISSHSYGFVSGWASQFNPPRWFGIPGEPEAVNFGLYDWYAMKWDELCANARYYLPFKSAGNNRIDSAPPAGHDFKVFDNGWQVKSYDPAVDPPGDGEANSGYDTIPLIGNAKNVMTVGAVGDAVLNGRRSLEAAAMTSYSGWGPTDDGRIKPDIVANGSRVYSSKAADDASYGVMSGTSMAAPSAAGGAALLVDLYGQLFPGEAMPSCLLKGLILHTADDLGRPGPDYTFGWGLMNTEAAAEIIKARDRAPRDGALAVETLVGDVEHRARLYSDGQSPIRVTLCWTDAPAPNRYELDNRTPCLVNDLDLRLIAPDGSVYLPFVLNPDQPEQPAEPGDNDRDNVEQVVIRTPVQAGEYQVVILADGELAGGMQEFALIVSGLAGSSAPPTLTLRPSDDVVTGGVVPISGTVADEDHDLCCVQLVYSVDGGTQWHQAVIAGAEAPDGFAIDNASMTQLQGLPTPEPASFRLEWDSRAGAVPVQEADSVRLRMRAWDGQHWSSWAETLPFVVDNQGPDMSQIELKSDHQAFGRYVLTPTFHMCWSNVTDPVSGVGGYYIGVNDPQLAHAVFSTNLSHTITNLARGEENVVYLWAVDGLGNSGDPVQIPVFVLDLEHGSRSPAPRTESGSAESSPPAAIDSALHADLIQGLPILRCGYHSRLTYQIERCTRLDDPEGWQICDAFSVHYDGDWQVWAACAGSQVDGPGFYRVRTVEPSSPPEEEEPPEEEDPPPDSNDPGPGSINHDPAPRNDGPIAMPPIDNLWLNWLLALLSQWLQQFEALIRSWFGG